MKKAEAYWPLILLMALIKFVLPIFLQSPVYELQRDEFLYYQQGQHLALGYLENPPLLSWLGWISSWFGGSEAWIKFWPCLFGAATVILTCLITAELGGGRFAQFLAGLGIITGAYMRIHFLFQPNILDIFSWTLAIYFLVLYVNSKQVKYLYGLTLSIAFGWWGKYSILFLALALLIGLLMSPHRKIFLNKHFWFAAGIGILLMLPNIIWQYQHNWPLLHHMDELRETQLRYLSPADFIKDQFLMLLPLTLVWIAGLVWLLKNPSYRFLGIIYLTVIILLMLGSGKSYYALGAYPMLLAAGASAWESFSQKRRWIRFGLILFIILLTIPFIPMLLPVWEPAKLAGFYKKAGIEKTGLLRWEDQRDHPLPQDFADMLGWEELAQKAERFYTSLPGSVKRNTVIYGRHYGHAGSLAYYTKDKELRKKVITDNGSFLLWIPEDLHFDHLLFIGRRFPDADDSVFQHFQQHHIVDSVTHPYSRQKGDKIIFFENIDSRGRQLATEGLKEMKETFIR